MKSPITLRSLALAGLAIFSPHTVRADVRLPAIFSDHAVLLSAASVPVWGWADAGEEVEVSFAGQTKSATPDANGKWMVKLNALKPGGPQELIVKGKNTLTVKDVLVGEVWLGSGQSNMAMTVNRAKDFEQEKAAANLPQVRMFTVSSGASTKPEEDCKGSWIVCSPETVASFSATLYFFGREIHKALGVPVGLINSSVGGTPIESWIAPEVQQASPELKEFFEIAKKTEKKFDPEAAKAKFEKDLAKWEADVKQARAEKKPLPKKPADPVALRARKGNVGGLFNGKIAPLIPYAIRGALWYQGEANTTAEKAPFYQHQLALLVTDWRKRWGSEFPFAWVQLPNFTRAGDGWPLVREAMLKTLKLPKTGMAITIDTGEQHNIHPANKQEVGRRLSLWALGTVYGKNVASTSGPLPAGHEVKDNTIVLKFSHADGGLAARGGDGLRGFMVAGEDRQWKPATARVEGGNVIVSSAEVPKPVAVRYAWQDWPDCNLVNGDGLPASPFRTDEW
ncbi:MAG: sialate O-acetylesterase [Chthoniobacteraceae bacterium]